MSESAAAAVRPKCLAVGRDVPLDARDARDDELRDAIAGPDRVRPVAEIDECDLDLAAVVRIDRAGRVQHGHAGADGEPAPRPHLCLESIGESDRETGRDEAALEWSEDLRLVEQRLEIAPGRSHGHVKGRGAAPGTDAPDRNPHRLAPRVPACHAAVLARQPRRAAESSMPCPPTSPRSVTAMRSTSKSSRARERMSSWLTAEMLAATSAGVICRP